MVKAITFITFITIVTAAAVAVVLVDVSIVFVNSLYSIACIEILHGFFDVSCCRILSLLE